MITTGLRSRSLCVVLDGVDLGVGVLSLFAGEADRRGIMTASLGRQRNLAGTVRRCAVRPFPLVCGVALHAPYIPMMLMLFGLVSCRGVRVSRARTPPRLWGSPSASAVCSRPTPQGSNIEWSNCKAGLAASRDGTWAGCRSVPLAWAAAQELDEVFRRQRTAVVVPLHDVATVMPEEV